MRNILFILIISLIFISLTGCAIVQKYPPEDLPKSNEERLDVSKVETNSPEKDKQNTEVVQAENPSVLSEENAITVLREVWKPLDSFYKNMIPRDDGFNLPPKGLKNVEDTVKYLETTMSTEIAIEMGDFLVMEWDDGTYIVRPTEMIYTVHDGESEISVVSIKENKITMSEHYSNELEGEYDRISIIEKKDGKWILTHIDSNYN